MGYVADEGPVSCRRIRGGHQSTWTQRGVLADRAALPAAEGVRRARHLAAARYLLLQPHGLERVQPRLPVRGAVTGQPAYPAGVPVLPALLHRRHDHGRRKGLTKKPPGKEKKKTRRLYIGNFLVRGGRSPLSAREHGVRCRSPAGTRTRSRGSPRRWRPRPERPGRRAGRVRASTRTRCARSSNDSGTPPTAPPGPTEGQ